MVVVRTRAIADGEALILRHSNKSIFRNFEPKGEVAKSLYKMAEKIRCEKIGSEKYGGIKKKFEDLLQISKQGKTKNRVKNT